MGGGEGITQKQSRTHLQPTKKSGRGSLPIRARLHIFPPKVSVCFAGFTIVFPPEFDVA